MALERQVELVERLLEEPWARNERVLVSAAKRCDLDVLSVGAAWEHAVADEEAFHGASDGGLDEEASHGFAFCSTVLALGPGASR